MNSPTFSSRQPGARLLYRFLTKFFHYAQGLANTGQRALLHQPSDLTTEAIGNPGAKDMSVHLLPCLIFAIVAAIIRLSDRVRRPPPTGIFLSRGTRA